MSSSFEKSTNKTNIKENNEDNKIRFFSRNANVIKEDVEKGTKEWSSVPSAVRRAFLRLGLISERENSANEIRDSRLEATEKGLVDVDAEGSQVESRYPGRRGGPVDFCFPLRLQV